MNTLERLAAVVWTCRHDAPEGGAVWLEAGGRMVEAPEGGSSPRVWLAAPGLGVPEVLVFQFSPGAAYRPARYGVCRECWEIPDAVLHAKMLAKRARG